MHHRRQRLHPHGHRQQRAQQQQCWHCRGELQRPDAERKPSFSFARPAPDGESASLREYGELERSLASASPPERCAKGWPEPPQRSTAGIDAHALGRSPRAQPRVLAAARRATLRTTQLRHDRRWSPPGSFACWLRCEARRIVGARPPIAHIAACGPRHRPWPRFHASGRSDFALLAVVRIGAMNLPLSPYPHLRSPEASVFLLPRPARFLAGAARSGAWPAYRYP